MMKVTSAPLMDDATRAALASGRADPSLALFVDTLMEMRGISEAEGAAFAGAMLEGEQPVAMSVNALDMAFAAIERGAARARKGLVYPELASVPDVLREAIAEAEARRGWEVYGVGIRRLRLGVGEQGKAEIIRLEPGVKVPWHTHKGQELTLCIHGEFSEGRGTYGPGDFSISDGAVRHQPVAYERGPAYALAVTTDGLRFEGLLGALQKLIGG